MNKYCRFVAAVGPTAKGRKTKLKGRALELNDEHKNFIFIVQLRGDHPLRFKI